MRESFQKLETPVSAEAAADKPTSPETGQNKPVSPEKQEKERGSQEVEEFLDKEAEILAAYGLRGTSPLSAVPKAGLLILKINDSSTIQTSS